MSLVVHGYGLEPGIGAVGLVALVPASATVPVGHHLLVAAVLAAESSGVTTVSLACDAPAVLSVPASVDVPDGSRVGTFFVEALGTGAAQLTAELDGAQALSFVDVEAVHLVPLPTALRPTALQPGGSAAVPLSPGFTGSEDADPPLPSPTMSSVAIEPDTGTATNLKPSPVSTEEV